MKIEIIELLNLVHDNKAPKKILYGYCEYRFSEEENDYQNNDGLYLFEWLFENERDVLTKKVEIIEEKPKKIEKISLLENYSVLCGTKYNSRFLSNILTDNNKELNNIKAKLNDVIETVNYLLEKSDKDE